MGRRLTMRRLDPPSPDVERREGAARDAGPRAERREATRAARARGQIESLAAGPAGYPFSRRP
jgi:hypothetical protein